MIVRLFLKKLKTNEEGRLVGISGALPQAGFYELIIKNHIHEVYCSWQSNRKEPIQIVGCSSTKWKQ